MQPQTTESITSPSDLPVSGRRPRRIRIGEIGIDVITFAEALEEIAALVDRKQGGVVYTPNVDHVVLADSDSAFRTAYERASLSLADGMPVVWVGRLLAGAPLEQVAGSDLFLPLMELAAQRPWRVYLLGGAPGVAEEAAKRLAGGGVAVVGWDSPAVPADGATADAVAEQVAAARPDLVLVALGTPKQELWIHRASQTLSPAVVLGCGAALDFFIGRQQRAPRWLSRVGLEWLYRLCHEPRRLWRRYLIRDPRFALIAFTSWWSARRQPSAAVSARG